VTPTARNPAARKERILTRLTPLLLGMRGRFRARSSANYATSCVRRINAPALACVVIMTDAVPSDDAESGKRSG
jgi:hypothetical protein